MTVDISALVRRDVATMEPYHPIVPFEVLAQRLGRPVESIIKLDANENPYGPSPRVAEALARGRHYHIYPDPESRELVEALSRFLQVEPRSLMVGHGADELIDLTMRLFIEPGDGVIDCPPTFGMYRFDAAVNGARLLRVPRRAGFSLDVEGIERAAGQPRVKLLFLTSPNNPDGGLLGDAELKRLLALPVVVVLDEAYIEFGGESRVRWVADYPNLIVLRTLSKWAGLAGLRVGYGAFPAEVAAHLRKIKQPYNVNVAGSIAALASLEDRVWLLANVAKIVAERRRLAAALARIPFIEPYPSHANFILCRVIGREAVGVTRALEADGILVRYYDQEGLRDHIRISVGLPQHSDALLEVLERLVTRRDF